MAEQEKNTTQKQAARENLSEEKKNLIREKDAKRRKEQRYADKPSIKPYTQREKDRKKEVEHDPKAIYSYTPDYISIIDL